MNQLIKKLFFSFISGEKIDLTPGLKINRSIVPACFEQANPTWDKNLFTNIQYI